MTDLSLAGTDTTTEALGPPRRGRAARAGQVRDLSLVGLAFCASWAVVIGFFYGVVSVF